MENMTPDDIQKSIVELNLVAPYQPAVDVSPHEHLDIRLDAVLQMAQTLDQTDNRIKSIIIDADKALKIHRRKRWWQLFR